MYGKFCDSENFSHVHRFKMGFESYQRKNVFTHRLVEVCNILPQKVVEAAVSG